MEASHRSINLRIGRLKDRNKRVQEKLGKVKNIRLMITLTFIFLVFMCALYPQWRVELYLFLVYTFVFIYLFVKTQRLSVFLKRSAHLEEFYKRQWQRSQGSPVASYVKNERGFSVEKDDLNIFGEFSVFNLLDETFSNEGRDVLTRLLREPGSFFDTIEERQKKIKSMGENRWAWYRFLQEGGLSKERMCFQESLDFMKMEKDSSYKKNIIWQSLLWGSWVSSVVLFPQVSGWLWGIYFVFIFTKSHLAMSSFSRGESLIAQLRAVRPVFKWLENDKNRGVIEKIETSLIGLKVHGQIKKLERSLSFLSIQANPLVFILVNSLFPWSSLFSFLVEEQKTPLFNKLDKVFDKIAYLEALSSLSTLWAYQTKVFPQRAEEKILSLEGVYHPLLPRDEVVKNSVSLSKDKVILLTGSNMAGKSTFLRTIGINQALFLAGAPVFAEKMQAWPFPLLSCLEVSDSVRDGLSYFHAEVLHLKKLLGKAKTEPHLYFIDEIYRGTNNKERFRGSYALISELAKTSSLGFVSTHDLELASLEKEGSQIVNYHFSDHFENEEMRFSYRLKKGLCVSTNALKIMASHGLPV